MAGPYFIKVVYLAHKKGFWYGWVSQKSTNAIWPAIFQKNLDICFCPIHLTQTQKKGDREDLILLWSRIYWAITVEYNKNII